MVPEDVAGTAKRLSLTKAQRATAAGAELLSLCQTVTADGSLSQEEIGELRNWLQSNREADLPSIDHLIGVVDRIIADGVVTPDERRELFMAIEAVLPSDVRSIAKNARRSKEQTEKDRLKLQADMQRQQAREEKERNRPIYQLDVMVAGAKYEGRPQVIRRHARGGDQAHLVRDPSNRHSRNAVAIYTASGHHIGFVPEEDAAEIAPMLDARHAHRASIKKVLTGSTHPIPVVVADIYARDATVKSLPAPSAARSTGGGSQGPSPTAMKQRWLLWAVIAFAIIVLLNVFSK